MRDAISKKKKRKKEGRGNLKKTAEVVLCMHTNIQMHTCTLRRKEGGRREKEREEGKKKGGNEGRQEIRKWRASLRQDSFVSFI